MKDELLQKPLEMHFAERSEETSFCSFNLTDTKEPGLYCLPGQEGTSPFGHGETGHWCGFLFSNKNCREDNPNY